MASFVPFFHHFCNFLYYYQIVCQSFNNVKFFALKNLQGLILSGNLQTGGWEYIVVRNLCARFIFFSPTSSSIFFRASEQMTFRCGRNKAVILEWRITSNLSIWIPKCCHDLIFFQLINIYYFKKVHFFNKKCKNLWQFQDSNLKSILLFGMS